MEEQEFVIKGTVAGMIKILQEDFDMSYEEAKFFIYIMIDRASEEAVNAVDKEELDKWYLMQESDKYAREIFNTHLVINFTTIKKSLCHVAYIFFVKYLFAKGIDLVLIGADLIYIVISAIQKIENTDYCIFARIVELCIGNKDSFFDIKDIVTANKDGKCDYQIEDWRCTYLHNSDNCTCNEQKVKLAFNNLEKQNKNNK